MILTRPGILAIFNNVAAGREAEFEEWFQHEHLQERLGVPGSCWDAATKPPKESRGTSIFM